MTDKTVLLRRCVLAESVYNMLSFYGDTTIEMVVKLLRSSWTPMWNDVRHVVTNSTVADVANWLANLRLVQIADTRITIPVRDPKTGLGRSIRTDYHLAELVWNGKRGLRK